MDLEHCRGGRGKPFDLSLVDVAALGYTDDEYLLRGTATAYDEAGEVARARYVTRVLVRTPATFAGTVVVEWLNVSGYVDAGVEWQYTHTELARRGFAWVGVSAQLLGVIGAPRPVEGPAPGGLKAWDPERYAALDHPGDDFSYDIFSQAGSAVRELFPRSRLIAAGMSSSAFRLSTYVNAIDPIAEVYDGFLVHGRIGAVAPLLLPPGPPRPENIDWTPVPCRADPRVPVLTLQTETDVFTLGYVDARQPDGDHFRLWEVAGAAHADTYLDVGDVPDPKALAAALAPRTRVVGFDLPHLANSGPQHHYVANAAVHHLDRWIRGEGAPPRAPRLGTVPGPPPALDRDEYGNARGGIRTPWMDAPTAVLTGISPHDGVLERLFGQTIPFPQETLDRLYPGPDDYRAAFDAATDEAIKAGFLLEADEAEIKALI